MTLLPASRLMPLLILVAFVMLGVRSYDFWQGWNDPGHYSWGTPALAVEHSAPADTTPTTPPATATAAAAPAPTTTPTASTSTHAPSSATAPSASAGTTAAGTSSATGAEAAAAHEPAPRAMPTEFTPAEVQVLQNLAQRRDELDKRAAELDQREVLMTAAEQRIDGKVTELENLRTELQGLLTKIDGQEQDRISSLVKIYETMKPREAAAILEGLEMEVALDVLERMRETKSAPILASMDPQKASQITVEMSKRHQLPEIPQ